MDSQFHKNKGSFWRKESIFGFVSLKLFLHCRSTVFKSDLPGKFALEREAKTETNEAERRGSWCWVAGKGVEERKGGGEEARLRDWGHKGGLADIDLPPFWHHHSLVLADGGGGGGDGFARGRVGKGNDGRGTEKRGGEAAKRTGCSSSIHQHMRKCFWRLFPSLLNPSRLSHKSFYISIVSHNAFGRRIIEHREKLAECFRLGRRLPTERIRSMSMHLEGWWFATRFFCSSNTRCFPCTKRNSFYVKVFPICGRWFNEKFLQMFTVHGIWGWFLTSSVVGFYTYWYRFFFSMTQRATEN